VRYFTLGAPPGRRGTAWLPGMPISPKALQWGFWGRSDQLAGYPGNKAIPAPTKSTVPSPDIGDHAQGGTSYSRDAPDAIFPSLYYVRGRQNHPPVSLLRTNNMPIPAGDLYKGPPGWVGGTQATRLAQIAARTSRVGGIFQTGWPAAPVSWPWGNTG